MAQPTENPKAPPREQPRRDRLWLWFAVPLLLLAAIAAALYLMGDGSFSGGSGYDVR